MSKLPTKKESLMPTYAKGAQVVVFNDGVLAAEGPVTSISTSWGGLSLEVEGKEFSLCSYTRSMERGKGVVVMDKAEFEKQSLAKFIREQSRTLHTKMKVVSKFLNPDEASEVIDLFSRLNEIISAHDEDWKGGCSIDSFLKFNVCKGNTAEQIKTAVVSDMLYDYAFYQVDHVKAGVEQLKELESKKKQEEDADRA